MRSCEINQGTTHSHQGNPKGHEQNVQHARSVRRHAQCFQQLQPAMAPRSCQAEEGVIGPYFERLVSQRADPEVGLLIGRPAVGTRDLLLGLVRTPEQDGQPAAQLAGSKTAASSSSAGSKAKKGGSTSTSSAAAGGLQLQGDWVAEHAAQAARMLPGGLSVLGCYIFCPDSVVAASGPAICQMLAAVREAVPVSAAGGTGGPGELLLLLADSSRTGKLSLRAVPQGCSSLTSGSQLLEMKPGPCASNLVQLRARFNLSLSLATPTSSRSLQQQLSALVERAAEQIRSTVVIGPSGSLPADDTSLLDVLPTSVAAPAGSGKAGSNNSSSSSSALPSVSLQLATLHRPADAAAAAVAGAGQPVQGIGRLVGVMESVTYAHKRDPWSRVVADLRADLESSLRARLELMVEDALSAQEEEGQQEGGKAGEQGQDGKAVQHPLLSDSGLAKAAALGLPRRVLLPWQNGLHLCDYLLHGEEAAAAAERGVELLGLPGSGPEGALPEEAVHLLEAVPVLPRKQGAWDPHAPASQQQQPQGAGSTQGKAVAGVAVSGSVAAGGGAKDDAGCAKTMGAGALMGGAAVVLALAVLIGVLSMSA